MERDSGGSLDIWKRNPTLIWPIRQFMVYLAPMSCEQLLAEIDKKGESVPSGSEEAVDLAMYALTLEDACPSRRSQLTHTAEILNAERNAEVDRIWKQTKKEAEGLLNSLESKG